MTTLQENRKKLLLEEGTSDQQRSIILVDIMNAMGFSERQRKIEILCSHLTNVILDICLTNSKFTQVFVGSKSEGISGGIFYDYHHDSDTVLINTAIKLCPPRANKFKGLPYILPEDKKYYDAYFFVEEDDKFPGYAKLSMSIVKTSAFDFCKCTRKIDGTLYLSNYLMRDVIYKKCFEESKNYIPTYIFQYTDVWQIKNRNGPAYSKPAKFFNRDTDLNDTVYCIRSDMWPDSAKSFITRCRPNNWPSNKMLESIKDEGFDVAPVGHHDNENNDTQWRISFPGERILLLNFNDVQILCYALIKIIVRENLNSSQREVVSSFHIKHVLFWCVELCSCQWVVSNYINCLNICLTKLIEWINARHIPHYIIRSRNLFNSKMTEKMSKEIVDVLRKYDTKHVLKLGVFKHVLNLIVFDNADLKRLTLTSTIMACFNMLTSLFMSLTLYSSLVWSSYIPRNATTSLLKYKNTLQYLKKEKKSAIQCFVYVVRSMLGVLYYAKYKESNNSDFLIASKKLIEKSLNLEYSCVKLRAATFFLINLEYGQSIEICDSFLSFPPRQQIDSSFREYRADKNQKVYDLLMKKPTEEIEKIMEKILLIVDKKPIKLKCLPGKYDIAQQNPVWIFKNFTNIFFHDLYLDVIFMTAEQWVVPDPIQYELLSLSDSDNEHYPCSCILLDPRFVCIQTKFLCYHAIGNVNRMAEMLTLMNSLIKELPSCVYLNMLAYCQIKAGHHRESVKSILKSLRMFPSRYNTASGYLKIVLQILNSLSI